MTLRHRWNRFVRLAGCLMLVGSLLALLACGGDEDVSPVGKKGGGEGGEDGGPPARPQLPGRSATPPPATAKATNVAPISAAEYARKKADWEAFQRKQEGLPEATGPAGGGKSAVSAMQDLPPGVRAWYTDYSAVATSVKLALPRYLQAVQGGDAATINSACAELGSATGRLLGDPTALNSPVPGVKDALTTAYRNYQSAADACVGGRTAERDARIAAANQAMQTAATALRAYQIEP